MLSSVPANAYGGRHAFCIQDDEYPALSTCTFASYQQCQATASGRDAWCDANPTFHQGRELQAARINRRSL
jgi:Protein of unknown function (DUF3551)